MNAAEGRCRHPLFVLSPSTLSLQGAGRARRRRRRRPSRSVPPCSAADPGMLGAPCSPCGKRVAESAFGGAKDASARLQRLSVQLLTHGPVLRVISPASAPAPRVRRRSASAQTGRRSLVLGCSSRGLTRQQSPSKSS